MGELTKNTPHKSSKTTARPTFISIRCEDGGGGAATGTGGRTASLRLANGRVAAQSAEQLPHSPADCASVRISMDNTNTCCTDSLVTALDDETLLLGNYCKETFISYYLYIAIKPKTWQFVA
ncbi:unnamed protein product [Arctia plantaginis]|uniref:Uncharacterized protein n=1 Tax=Arctia plantaginis TaxID=874455 RepID=A0A8S0Z7R5_ARCPL|nr:unnamed protein product [Arctia plantaginis]CAB3257044.1 unnamed protein product [Arctia plantaginis]